MNCPLTDFSDPAARATMARAIEETFACLPLPVPIVIGGKARLPETEAELERFCPSERARLVARVGLASREDADRALQTAMQFWPAWREMELHERAGLLQRLAEHLERDRMQLAALETIEVAKPWAEADADVAEAIDYCRYYARQALSELAPRRLGDVPGEVNTLSYEGRGPAVIIAPWNFPLAILTGMTAAALVAGNTVVMKPAEQSSAIAHALFGHMLAAGFPPEVVQFVPGRGEEVGAALVVHPLTAQIAFTGSKKVGLSIIELAARTAAGQPQVRRVVCEMGGKNAIVVDEDADLDEAVAGVMKSAFGYAGQKCSAGSRVVVVGAAWDPVRQTLDRSLPQPAPGASPRPGVPTRPGSG